MFQLRFLQIHKLGLTPVGGLDKIRAIDRSVYTRNQEFRMPGLSKKGGGHPLRIMLLSEGGVWEAHDARDVESSVYFGHCVTHVNDTHAAAGWADAG